MTTTTIGIAGNGNNPYVPINVDKVLPSIFPVVGSVPAHIEVLNGVDFDTLDEYADAIEVMAIYYSRLKDSMEVENLEELIQDSYFIEGDQVYVLESDLPEDISYFAGLLEGEKITTETDLYDVFANSVAYELGTNQKRYGRYNLNDVVSGEFGNYTISPQPDGNGAVFKRVEAVVGQQVRASTAPDWSPIEDDEHY